MDEYVEMIERAISEDSIFREAADIVRKNSSGGKIWAFGSFLYKNIIREKYGVDNLVVGDYDFILEEQIDYSEIWCPEDWDVTKTFFGSPRLIRGNDQIDFYSLDDAVNYDVSGEEFLRMSSDEQIRTHLRNQLFDVQAMGYELNSGELYDEGGIGAIKKGEFRIASLENCKNISKKKGVSLVDYLNYKSGKIGLRAVLDNL